MGVNADGKYPITVNGRTVLVDAAVTVDATGTPSGGGGGGLEGAFFTSKLTDNGTGEGDAATNKDYSGTAGRVWLTVPTGYRLDVYEIRMGGMWSTTASDYDKFFNLPALTNGVEIASASVDGATTRTTLYASDFLKSNADWFLAAAADYPVALLISGVITKYAFQRRLTSPMSVVAGDCMNVALHDDFSSLAYMYFEVEGRLVPV